MFCNSFFLIYQNLIIWTIHTDNMWVFDDVCVYATKPKVMATVRPNVINVKVTARSSPYHDQGYY